MTDVYSLSKYGHNSMPKGLSMVGKDKFIELKDSKDIMRDVCAGAPGFSSGRVVSVCESG